MRVSITYLYTIFRYGYPHRVEDTFTSLAELHNLGLHFLEMEGLGPRHLRSLYDCRKALLRLLDDSDLHVHNFCVVDPDLVTLDITKRSRALERFQMAAELADTLGCDTLHVASYPPPVRYLDGTPYQLDRKAGYRFADHPRILIPDSLDWSRVWCALVESCQCCADIAAQHGKTLMIEPRVGEVIASVDSLLRLLEHVGRPNFRANFDTAHFCAQRENVCLALVKLRGQFANIHVADNDPVNTAHLPIGEGIIDWNEFFRLLKLMNYDGYLGLDFGKRRSPVPAYRRSIAYMQAITSKLGITLEV